MAGARSALRLVVGRGQRELVGRPAETVVGRDDQVGVIATSTPQRHSHAIGRNVDAYACFSSSPTYTRVTRPLN